VSWASIVAQAVVAAVLVALVGLVFWSVAPRVAGFQGHVVVSGSMQPRLAPGDVVLTREVTPQQLQPGQVLLFPDPERPDRLLLHRLVSFDADGDLVTRGDANQSNDSAHVPAGSVIGRAQLRVPHVGLPAYWRAQGQWGHIGLVAGLLAAATVFATRGSRSSAGEGAEAPGFAVADVVPTPTATAHHPAAHGTRNRTAHRTRYRGGHQVSRRAGSPARAPRLVSGPS
jgi:signal peptidase